MRLRLQSAMEYLMTYGWAILIIAVVLGVLYYIGVFNGANLAPKVPAGACQVVRPDGPGTTQYINTEGECGRGLPEYAADMKYSATQNDIITMPAHQLSTAAGAYTTITFWMDWNTSVVASSTSPIGFATSSGGSADYVLLINTNCFGFNTNHGDNYGINTVTPISHGWVFVAAIFYNGAYTGQDQLYLNGVQQTMTQCSGSASSASVTKYLQVSGPYAVTSGDQAFPGYVSNIQLYNTSLDANSIESLYTEGIGGDPQVLGSLVGWWPLDGDVNDYSGDFNEGSAPNLVFTESWINGYV